MAVYRDGAILGTPDQIQTLLNSLADSVASASASASASATSAANAESSANSAQTLWDTFNNLYLGAFDTDPTTDNDGSALEGGELYYNNTTNLLYAYDLADTAWNPVVGSGDFLANGTVPMTGNLQMGGNEITKYSESDSSPSSSSGTLTLDMDNGNIFNVTLTENVTTLTISNVPPTGGVNIVLVLTQDATGSRTVTWPASVKWAGGTQPTLTTTANAIDIITMFSVDGGVSWFSFISGQDMQ